MRILIAHADGLMLAGMRQVLSDDGTFVIVCETHVGRDVLFLVGEHCPDVLLLEAELLGVDVFACLCRIREQYPRTAIVVCSLSSTPDLIQAAFDNGACGFIAESIHPADLVSAISQALEAGNPLPASNADKTDHVAPALTAREADVLEAVARGLANKAVAAELSVTIQTVKFHLTSVYRKLGVTNRTEAARWALHHGLGS